MVHRTNATLRLLVSSLLALPIAIGILRIVGISPMPMLDAAIGRLPTGLASWTGLRSADPAVIGHWPPVKGEAYPDLVLQDQNGDTVRLSSLAGRIILLELAAVPCQGCQAFAGGQQFGGYDGVGVQPGLESIHHYVERYAGIQLGSDEVVFVQLLLYGKSMSSPSAAEVAGWAKHFQLTRSSNTIVLRGDASLLGPETMQRIPGFHLIDEQFVLRFDSSGDDPDDDLYQDLLPALGQMVNEHR